MTQSDDTKTIQVLEIGIAILTILFENANSDKGLRVKDIQAVLLEKYNLAPTEKTIRSHLQTLHEIRPFNLEVSHIGPRWHIESILDTTQLRLLADALPETGIASYDMHSIIERLQIVSSSQAGKSIEFLKELDSKKKISPDYQLTVETLNEAISRKCMVAFQRLTWNAKGELAPKEWGGQIRTEEFGPIQMINKNGIRYVIGITQTRFQKEIGQASIEYFRVDRMHRVELLPAKKPPLKDVALPIRETFDLLEYRDDSIDLYRSSYPALRGAFSTFRVHVTSLDSLFDEFPQARIIKTIPKCETHFYGTEELEEEAESFITYSYEAEVAALDSQIYNWAAAGNGKIIGPEVKLSIFQKEIMEIAEKHGISCNLSHDKAEKASPLTETNTNNETLGVDDTEL